MGSRDRPGKEAKKKPKAKENKPQLQSLLQAPPPTVEVIKAQAQAALGGEGVRRQQARA